MGRWDHLDADGKKACLLKKIHQPTHPSWYHQPNSTRAHHSWRKLKPPPPPPNTHRFCASLHKSSIQWRYLSFCFAAAYTKLLEPPTKNTDEIPLPLPNPARFLSQLDDISKALDDALNEIYLVNKGIKDAITRFESSTSILKEKSRSNLGPSAHSAPTTIDCAVSPSLTTPPSGIDEDDPKDMANAIDAPIFSSHNTDDFDQEFAVIDSFVSTFISP